MYSATYIVLFKKFVSCSVLCYQVDRGCDINALTYHNVSPLGAAISNRDAEMTRYLLEAGAESGCCTDALTAALDTDDDVMAEILIKSSKRHLNLLYTHVILQ